MLSTNCAKYKHYMCGASAHPLKKAKKALSLTSEIITRHNLFNYKKTDLAHCTFILSTITGDCDAKSYKKT